MQHNALSRGVSSAPMWLIQAVVGTLLASGVTWATWASVTTWKHETKISVTEQRVNGIDKDLDEIKDGNKEMNRKLDRLIERR